MEHKEFTLEQRTFPTGSVIPTCAESFTSGFRGGLFWPDKRDYTPGGPFVYTSDRRDNKEDRVWCEASSAAAKAWHSGWKTGQLAKSEMRKAGMSLPSWTDTDEYRKAIDGK